MKCEDVLTMLEDYHDGELEQVLAGRVAAHLAACAGCAGQLQALKSENRLYREYKEELERELRLPPEMWQQIRAGIDAARAPRERTPLWFPFMRQVMFAAALIVISVGATLLAVRYYNPDHEDDSVARIRSESSGRTSLESALLSIRRAEAEYQDAIRVLSEIVERRKDTMDPRLIAELEANLRVIDESIAATRKAYLEHPTDPELAHYMLAAYSKKVELLQELSS